MTAKVESEKLIERKLREEIQAHGGMCIKLLSMHILGLPDRLCLMPRAVIAFAELKTTTQQPKKIQLFMHDKIRKLGFRVEVIDTVKGVHDFVNSLIKQQ